jgi:dsRNA-specific ribonuclease
MAMEFALNVCIVKNRRQWTEPESRVRVATAFEALIGAVHLDGGRSAATSVVKHLGLMKFMERKLRRAEKGEVRRRAKRRARWQAKRGHRARQDAEEKERVNSTRRWATNGNVADWRGI